MVRGIRVHTVTGRRGAGTGPIPTASGTPPRVHPERARLLSKLPADSVLPPPATGQDILLRTSKPVRIRRPLPQPPAQPSGESFLGAASRKSVAMENMSTADGAGRLGSLRRGASLLDRLSLDDPLSQSDVLSPSLRDRMELYPADGGVDEGLSPTFVGISEN